MKQHFKGYYGSSEEEIRALWASATIVFDANVLLDFHRYEPETSATYLGLASAFSERLWVPFQAVQEYHENRPGVRAGATSVHDDQIESITKLVNTISQAPRKSHLAAGKKHKALVDAAEELLDELKADRATVADRNAPTAEDHVLNHLSILFSDDKIGPKPSEDELKRLFKIGAERFANKTPPGYKDAGNKPGNRQYGDFVLWQQVMTHAKEKKLDIILVTEDAKEDWWVSAHGKQVMPRPELINEFREFTDGQSIHLYNGLSFFDYAAEEVRDKPTPEAIKAAREDLEDIAQQRAEVAKPHWIRPHWDGEQFPELAGPVSLAEIGAAAASQPFANIAEINETKAMIARQVKHMLAREEAGVERDDPTRAQLFESLKRSREQFLTLYGHAGYSRSQAQAWLEAYEGPLWHSNLF